MDVQVTDGREGGRVEEARPVRPVAHHEEPAVIGQARPSPAWGEVPEGDAVAVVDERELGPVGEPKESLHEEGQPLGAMLGGDRYLPQGAAIRQVDLAQGRVAVELRSGSRPGPAACPGPCIARVALRSAAADALIATAGPSLTGDGAMTVERRWPRAGSGHAPRAATGVPPGQTGG